MLIHFDTISTTLFYCLQLTRMFHCFFTFFCVITWYLHLHFNRPPTSLRHVVKLILTTYRPSASPAMLNCSSYKTDYSLSNKHKIITFGYHIHFFMKHVSSPHRLAQSHANDQGKWWIQDNLENLKLHAK